jgi:hypothetical protein
MKNRHKVEAEIIKERDNSCPAELVELNEKIKIKKEKLKTTP